MSTMEIRREMWMGAGALAFLGVVVWMIPPTTPLAPVAASVRARAGNSGNASAVAATMPAPVAAPTIPPADATPVTADATPPPPRFAEAVPPQPRWRDAPSDDADSDDADQNPASPDQAFAMGYRWAQSNEIGDSRDCRRWRGPAEVGCLAYLHASDSGDDEDEEEDVARPPQ